MISYTLETYTSEESAAGSEAAMFVCLHGNKGDTGLRRLMASLNNDSKFLPGSVSINLFCKHIYFIS